MPNKFTILTDGGWLLMSRLFTFEKGFALDNSEAQKKATAQAFKECLSQSMSRILNQFPDADNIVLMSEGGSWRKNLPIPSQLEDVTYKGHREKKPLDWTAIYKAYNEFAKNCEAAGITVSQHSQSRVMTGHGTGRADSMPKGQMFLYGHRIATSSNSCKFTTIVSLPGTMIRPELCYLRKCSGLMTQWRPC